MKRIIIHWTAGSYRPSGLDLTHYHRLIDGDGVVHVGRHPISANAGPGKLISGRYAAHTASCNTGSIGVAICAMSGATDAPLNPGKYPIKPLQVDTLVKLIVDLCDEYGIPITRETVLTHAEVQPTLGIRQAGKWDIRWLPGMAGIGGAVEVGDIFRERVRAQRRATPDPKPTKRPTGGFGAWLSSIFR